LALALATVVMPVIGADRLAEAVTSGWVSALAKLSISEAVAEVNMKLWEPPMPLKLQMKSGCWRAASYSVVALVFGKL